MKHNLYQTVEIKKPEDPPRSPMIIVIGTFYIAGLVIGGFVVWLLT